MLVRNGIEDRRHLDLWTAVTTGVVSQQIANDPGDHWTALADEVASMFLDHCQRIEPLVDASPCDRCRQTPYAPRRPHRE